MDTQIIGREREIKIINKLLDSKKSEFLALYEEEEWGKHFLYASI